MKTSPRVLGAMCTVIIALISTSSVAVNAQPNERGGPCGGASAPSQKVQVQVVGKQARQSVKVIGNFESDLVGAVVGELIVGQGSRKLHVTNWCRIWNSQETTSGHSSVVHVLGTMSFPDGSEMYVRVDLRSDEGGKARVRTRNIDSHDSHAAVTELDEEHGGWMSATGEGWLSVSHLRFKRTM